MKRTMHPAEREAREMLASEVEESLFVLGALKHLEEDGLMEETVGDGKTMYVATDKGRALIAEHGPKNLTFPELNKVLRRWRGRAVRVEIGPVAAPRLILESVERAPRFLPENELGLVFSDGEGRTTLTLLVAEEELEEAYSFEPAEVQLYVAGVKVLIMEPPEPGSEWDQKWAIA